MEPAFFGSRRNSRELEHVQARMNSRELEHVQSREYSRELEHVQAAGGVMIRSVPGQRPAVPSQEVVAKTSLTRRLLGLMRRVRIEDGPLLLPGVRTSATLATTL
jgi:hypothetical protein